MFRLAWSSSGPVSARVLGSTAFYQSCQLFMYLIIYFVYFFALFLLPHSSPTPPDESMPDEVPRQFVKCWVGTARHLQLFTQRCPRRRTQDSSRNPALLSRFVACANSTSGRNRLALARCGCEHLVSFDADILGGNAETLQHLQTTHVAHQANAGNGLAVTPSCASTIPILLPATRPPATRPPSHRPPGHRPPGHSHLPVMRPMGGVTRCNLILLVPCTPRHLSEVSTRQPWLLVVLLTLRKLMLLEHMMCRWTSMMLLRVTILAHMMRVHAKPSHSPSPKKVATRRTGL